jgi:hypothetical protein
MIAKKCPLCGETSLCEKHGEFRMELPPNIPGGFIVVPDTTWRHCESCGEDILSAELEQAINHQCCEQRTSG